jgi:molybdenum cofactor synthesis domain-containing protein
MEKNILMSKYPMIEMDDAFNLIKTRLNNFQKEIITIDTLKANNYISAEDIHSCINIPNNPTSMMDGYVVDYNNININHEVSVIGFIYAGDPIDKINKTKLDPNVCYYIATGASLPSTCNCVIPVEKVEQIDKHKIIKILKDARLENLAFTRKVGSDVSQGDLVLEKNKPINFADITVLASLGIKTVKVYKLPRVGILSSGNEICELKDYEEGKVVDTNRIFIKLLLNNLYPCIEIFDYKIITDDYESIKNVFETFIDDKINIVISSGGVSMGEKDLIKKFLEENSEILFGRLNMKPGKPTTFAVYKELAILGLPGNPVSFAVCSYIFVPYLLYLLQNFNFKYPTINSMLLHDYKLDIERPEYTRAM